jgi:hypothetical protein
MSRMRWVLAVLVTAAAGCGGAEESSRERAAAARAPAEYPVAYAVARDELGALAEQPLPEAVEGADVVGRSSWDGYTLAVLSEWLREHGVDLDRPRVPEAGRITQAWDVPVIVITAQHARRYGRRLERLRPSGAKLRAYYEAFSETSLATAGEGMAEYLEVVRAAMRAATGDRVVVLPMED